MDLNLQIRSYDRKSHQKLNLEAILLGSKKGVRSTLLPLEKTTIIIKIMKKLIIGNHEKHEIFEFSPFTFSNPPAPRNDLIVLIDVFFHVEFEFLIDFNR